MAHALVHILGSRSGYTTLDATAGLTSGDRAELEVLGFGDATSSEAMARLETHACMVGRRLRSGRFAISRMLPGGTDDKGRPTIEVVSLVLDASGYAAVAGAFARLADDVRFWRLARGAVARGYELPEQAPAESAREPGVLRAFDTWVAARKTGSIGVLAAQDAQSLLAMVALLDGQDLGECRWGVGVVSLSAPVDICTLAPATAAIGSRPVLRAATGESWLSPEMAHVEFHVAQNPLLPQRASLVSAVHIEPALDRDAEATPVAAAPRASASWRPSSPKRNLTMIAAITAAASLAVLVMTTAVYVRTGRAVNVVVDAASITSSDAEQQPAVVSGTDTLGGGTYPAQPPLPSDRDEDGLPDDSDPCPDQKGFAKLLLFEDEDGDGDGNALSAGREFCLLPSATQHEEGATRYLAKHTDQCDKIAGVFLPTPFYIDSDDDEVGSGPAKPFCVAAGTKTYAEAGVKHVLVGGDECPDVKGVLKPKTFYLDTDEDGLGDPNESTPHCGSTLAGRVDNAADSDDRVADPSKKPKAQDAVPVPPKEDPIKAAEKKMKAIVSKCRDIQIEIHALRTDQKHKDFTSDLGAQLEDLKNQEELLMSLQRELHSVRSGAGTPSGAPHRFVGRLWPFCQPHKCAFNGELEAEWRELLGIFSAIAERIESAESKYLNDMEAKHAGQGNKERQIGSDKNDVKREFDSAQKQGPKHLLNKTKLKEELELLDARRVEVSK
jgi:hypothetical protein